jgi:hypothetical protein
LVMGDMQIGWKDWRDVANENDGAWHKVDRRKFNMSKEEKLRLRISNIYDHNASMMFDK